MSREDRVRTLVNGWSPVRLARATDVGMFIKYSIADV